MLGNKDFLAGLIFLAFGLAAIRIGGEYPVGTLRNLGPANFPIALGMILGLFGIFLAARGLGWGARDAAPVAWAWRPVACIVASMLVFGFLVPRAGLVAALAAMFFVAALGGREFRFGEVLALTVVMSALAVGVFVYLLKLPLALWRGFYLV